MEPTLRRYRALLSPLAALVLSGAAGCIVVERPPPTALPVAEEPPPPSDEAVYEAPPEPEPARAVYVEPSYEPPPPIAVRFVPPPMRYEPPPPLPEAGMHWVGGYWVWDDGEWAWMSGHWVYPPRPEFIWVTPYYEVRGDLVIFIGGHWGPPGYVFRPPPPTVRVVVVEARPSYRGVLVVQARPQRGCFVPAPPGSRPGIVVPAPIGTAPQVVVSAPPVVRPGMVVRGNPHSGSLTSAAEGAVRQGDVTVFAPAGVTRSGRPVQAVVPGRPSLAASLPPRAAVAPPPPPPRALGSRPGTFSPVAVDPPTAGQRQRLPPTVSSHPTQQTLEARPAPGEPGRREGVREPALRREPAEPAHPAEPALGEPAHGQENREGLRELNREGAAGRDEPRLLAPVTTPPPAAVTPRPTSPALSPPGGQPVPPPATVRTPRGATGPVRTEPRTVVRPGGEPAKPGPRVNPLPRPGAGPARTVDDKDAKKREEDEQRRRKRGE
jgi:hypothetical protein